MDFDLRKSIHAPPGQKSDIPEMPCTQAYQMRPTLRLVQDSEAGAIAGTVDPALLAAPDCARLVYVFADGANAAGSTVPDDQDAVEPNPVVMAKADALTGRYRASFLPAGPYTVAWTCGLDDVAANDALVFSAAKGATVQANLATTVNFP